MSELELDHNLQYRQPEPSLFKKWYRNLLFKKLSDRAKRMMLLASLYGYFSEKKSVDEDKVIKLNRALNLASSHEAIKFPISIYMTIWKSLDHQINQFKQDSESLMDFAIRQTGEGQCEVITDLVIQHAPYWMLYGNRSSIRHDVSLLIQKMVP